MNQNTTTIALRDYMASDDGWGHEEGRKVHEALLRKVESSPVSQVIRVSLKGVRRTDASFPRESVVELARRFRKHRGFCIVDVLDRDILDNWDYAALKRDQPLVCWSEDQWRLMGPEPSRTSKPMFQMVMETTGTTAGEVSKKLGLSLTNASTKLKQLLENGFILRREETAASGGIEFVYFRIK